MKHVIFKIVTDKTGTFIVSRQGLKNQPIFSIFYILVQIYNSVILSHTSIFYILVQIYNSIICICVNCKTPNLHYNSHEITYRLCNLHH